MNAWLYIPIEPCWRRLAMSPIDFSSSHLQTASFGTAQRLQNTGSVELSAWGFWPIVNYDILVQKEMKSTERKRVNSTKLNQMVIIF